MNSALRRFADPICLDAAPSLSGMSAWVEHIPFGMNLVAAIRPEAIVELGTHAGDSYLALCHAVERCGIPARCYAVDTWQGDPHTGAYGPEVLALLRALHDARFGTFSRLVQSTFDDALPHFADGSIDLLHIDGVHTADAVRHDYETWRPKLSRRAVVLFHDTNVREHDFGVSVVWDELKARHPHFEFLHGHGLGVLAPSEEVPAALLPLLEARGDDAGGVRAFFFELGRRISVGLERDALARERDSLA